jgi:ferric-dicitrate binding protein FerR (iron transport regulator)
MHKGNANPGREGPSAQDAAEWYAHNEVGAAFNAETLMQWDSWASDPGNRQEYAEIAEIRQQARKMEPPSQVTRGELFADLESGALEEDSD